MIGLKGIVMDKNFIRAQIGEASRQYREASKGTNYLLVIELSNQLSKLYDEYNQMSEDEKGKTEVTEKKNQPKPKEYLINGDNYFPNTVATRSTGLPAGAYECGVTMDGAPFFKPIQIVTDTIIDLDDSAAVEVTNEIRKFWSTDVSDKFQQYGLVYKRGILLAGPPGTGKTITLARCAKMVINEIDGVCLFNPNPGTVKEYLRLIKEIEPNKKVLVMWEEFDSIIDHDESELLSLLDGETQVSNVVYLATTNYLSKIPARIKNRPSRFARVIEVDIPSKEVREQFLKAKLHESDLDKLDGLLQYSDGFVIDQVKDLIISVCCFGQEIAVAANKIVEMNANSVGMDDYQEEQAQIVFKKQSYGKKVKSPLQPV